VLAVQPEARPAGHQNREALGGGEEIGHDGGGR
jgi:hypothetical protein